jgi:hypothetical protein
LEIEMDELLKIVATGAVGALFGWLSGLLSGAQKAREEMEKWERSRKDTVDTSAGP